jgi:hypothetical protein
MNVIHGLRGFTTTLACCALVVGIAVAASAQTVLIDFGNDQSFRGVSVPNPDPNGNYWTSMRTGVFYQNLVDINNIPTTIDFGFSTGVGTDSYNGPAGPVEPIPNTPFDEPKDFVPFTNVDQTALGNLGGPLEAAFDFVAGPDIPNNNQVRFEIQQLDPAKKYELTFFGSHKYSNDATTVYSVYTDNTYTTLVAATQLNVQDPTNPAAHNRDQVATISNLSPQTSNILYVQFIGINGSLGYLNDMRIVGTAPALNGDYNADGKVDAADYVVWRKYAGTTHALPNDPNGGTIGPAQFATWRSNFGAGGPGAGSGLAGSTVPEPAAFLLALFAMTLLPLARWR